MNNTCKHTQRIGRRNISNEGYSEYKMYYYHELDDSGKKSLDNMQEKNSSWMRCSEHCRNAVREVQEASSPK